MKIKGDDYHFKDWGVIALREAVELMRKDYYYIGVGFEMADVLHSANLQRLCNGNGNGR